MHDILLARRRDAARVLGCSESQVLKYERAGLLHKVALPAIGDSKPPRSARYDLKEVQDLARRAIAQSRNGDGA